MHSYSLPLRAPHHTIRLILHLQDNSHQKAEYLSSLMWGRHETPWSWNLFGAANLRTAV